MKAVSQRIGPMMLTLVFAAVIFIPQPGIGRLVEGTLNGYVPDPRQAAVVGAAVTNQATIPIMRTRLAASPVALLWKPSGIANSGRDGIDQRTVQLSLRLVF
jgi:hypothetical protein